MSKNDVVYVKGVGDMTREQAFASLKLVIQDSILALAQSTAPIVKTKLLFALEYIKAIEGPEHPEKRCADEV